MSDKDSKDTQNDFEKKKKELDEKFEQLNAQVMGLDNPSIDDLQNSDLHFTNEQKKLAEERLAKLKNLSFNIQPLVSDNEFEKVPAYIRRNMKLYESAGGGREEFNEDKKIIGTIGNEVDENYHSANEYLSLYFSLNEYGEEEITEIISLLSDLYKSVGGDELEIKSIQTFEFVNQLNPEFA
jgi:DNA repair ATPase RecN